MKEYWEKLLEGIFICSKGFSFAKKEEKKNLFFCNNSLCFTYSRTSLKIWISILKEIYFLPSRFLPDLRGKFLKKKKKNNQKLLNEIFFCSSFLFFLCKIRCATRAYHVDRLHARVYYCAPACVIALCYQIRKRRSWHFNFMRHKIPCNRIYCSHPLFALPVFDW